VFSISSRIRRARTQAKLTQTELGRRLGVQRSAVTQWERDGGTTPNVCHLAQLAYETQVRFEWLATGRGPCNPDAGEFDSAVTVEDFARDELEIRVLRSLRRLPDRKREAVVRVVELLSA
jgi:transcriptional regulator with XRE-family HTH domain